MNGPKAGSRKAAVFEIFSKSGLEAAIAYGIGQGLKRGSIKSWAAIWARAEPEGEGAEPAAEERRPSAFDDFFAHPTHAQAVKYQQALLRRNGMASGAFHILQHEGRFAVVPAHIQPKGKLPQFEEGDWVCDTIVPDTIGRIVRAGPEVCEVKYVKVRQGYPADTLHNIPNVYLHKIDPPPATKTAKKSKKGE